MQNEEEVVPKGIYDFVTEHSPHFVFNFVCIHLLFWPIAVMDYPATEWTPTYLQSLGSQYDNPGKAIKSGRYGPGAFPVMTMLVIIATAALIMQAYYYVFEEKVVEEEDDALLGLDD